jgi:hypothetical protein
VLNYGHEHRRQPPPAQLENPAFSKFGFPEANAVSFRHSSPPPSPGLPCHGVCSRLCELFLSASKQGVKMANVLLPEVNRGPANQWREAKVIIIKN